MKDDHERLLSAAASAGVIGLIVGVARGVIQQKHGGWPAFARGLVASVLVAVLIGWSIDDAELSPTKLAAIVGVGAYLADDILLGLLEFGRMFGGDPLGLLQRVWSALRGGPKS